MLKRVLACVATLAALFAFGVPKSVMSVAEENISPYVVDFAEENAEEKFLPVYIGSNGKGKEENFENHWTHDETSGTITRVNDCHSTDVTGNYAALYLKNIDYGYFELNTQIRYGQEGLEGIVFGTQNMFVRHIASGNAVYLMPDPSVELGGSTVGNAKTSTRFNSKADYYDLTLKVCEEFVRVYVDGELKIDTALPVGAFEDGRIGLFTANTEGSFKGGVEVYKLNAAGERVVADEVVSVTGISMVQDTIETELSGEAIKIEVLVMPSNATNPRVRWLSEAPDIAVVDNNGYLHVLKEGTAVIDAIAMDGGYVANFVVRVTKSEIPLQGVTLDRTEIKMNVDEIAYLIAEHYPTEAENMGFRWSSSDTKVAMVNNGTVMALSDGECVITVKDYYGQYSASCTVIVGKGNEKKQDKGCNGSINVSAMLILSALAVCVYGGKKLCSKR